MEKVKGYSGLILVGIGGLAILSAIFLGIFNARQYSEYAVIGSLGGVVLAMLGNLIVQSTKDE